MDMLHFSLAGEREIHSSVSLLARRAFGADNRASREDKLACQRGGEDCSVSAAQRAAKPIIPKNLVKRVARFTFLWYNLFERSDSICVFWKGDIKLVEFIIYAVIIILVSSAGAIVSGFMEHSSHVGSDTSNKKSR